MSEPPGSTRHGPRTVAGHAPGADGMQGFDLAIRLLTALVLLALTGSMGLLIYRAVAPRLAPAPAPAAASAGGPAQNTAPAPANAGARGDEVMMAPGRVFRCTEQGRPTFSDRACGGRTN